MRWRPVMLSIGLACGGTTSQNDAGTLCTPGTTTTCAGQNECAGTATCNVSGTAIGACYCAGADASTQDASANPDASADVTNDGGTWSPKSLPGLCVWLDDTTGLILNGSGYAQTWSDQSGHGNNAVAGGQGVPIIKSALNNHDAVQLNGNSLTIDDAVCLQFGTAPFAIVMVASAQSGGATTYVWSKNQTNDGLIWTYQVDSKNQTQSDHFATTHTATVTFSNVSAGVFHLVELDGPALAFTVDTVRVDGGIATDDLSNPGTNVTIGGGAELDLAEVIVVSQSISSADEVNLQTYFSGKFAL